jgi:hypothetical protein
MATLKIDPNRVPPPVTAATTTAAQSRAATSHIGIPVFAFDATGKIGLYDVADLDDASIAAWLEQISDPLKRIKYRKQLRKLRVPTGVTQ